MQFSTIIGVYLFAMGIGSFLSRYFSKTSLPGSSASSSWYPRWAASVRHCSLYFSRSSFPSRYLLYLLVLITGILVGLEIPLLMRILKNKVEFKELVSQVFAFDYIGALLSSVIFPLLLVPHLELIRTSLMFGILNALVGLILCFKFEQEIPRPRVLKMSAVLVILLQLVAFCVLRPDHGLQRNAGQQRQCDLFHLFALSAY